MFAASPSPTMEAAFGRPHRGGRIAFGSAATFVDSIVGDGEEASVAKTCIHISNVTILSFEGVCVNYRHPDPRRGEPRVGFAPDVAFPVDRVDRVDPVDPVQNSVRLANIDFYNDLCTFCRNWGPMFGPNP